MGRVKPTVLVRPALWLLLVLTSLAYANSFAGVFLFDDRAVILDDSRLTSVAAFRARVGSAIRPLTKATFLLDRRLYGPRPAGYHVLNLILHIASGLLLYRILLHRAFQTAGGTASDFDQGPPGVCRQIACWTTLLFLLHPIATETVTYISGRPTGLMTCGYLAAFLLFLDARVAAPGSARQRVAVASGMACLALSLLAKEVAVVFPALLALYEVVPGRSHRATLRSALIRVHAPLFAVVAVFLCYAAFHERYIFLFQYSLQLRGWYENLLTQANTVAYSISLFVRPTELNFDHDLPLSTSILQGATFFSIAALASLVMAAVVVARRAPLVSFGLLWFFLHVLPTNSLLARYDFLSERNLYLPSIGLYLATVAAAAPLARRVAARFRSAPRAARIGGIGAKVLQAALVAGLVVATIRRNALYADPVTFWQDAANKSPGKARPHTNLGEAWFEAGDLDRAIDQFRMALALDPLDRVAQENLLETWTQKTQAQSGTPGASGTTRARRVR